jgi:hypothetical protein
MAAIARPSIEASSSCSPSRVRTAASAACTSMLWRRAADGGKAFGARRSLAASTAWGMALGHSILRLTGRMSPL